jgi:CheY-like chemotaxis protein
MKFQALLVSKDEETSAVLTPVLSGFDVAAACCGYPEALCRVTEEKFDLVLVDFDDPHSATLVLQNANQSGSGHSVITVALLSDRTKLRNVFGAGANFALYKPISTEQAEAGLRAATALMKRERRRSFRVPVQFPVQLRLQGSALIEGILLDLSEDGMDVLAAQTLFPSATLSAQFTLPGTDSGIEVQGEVAWANPNGQSGVRFTDLLLTHREILKAWLTANAPEAPPDDPEPVSHCKLTDLSLGACYVETESPFPERSGITLSLKAGEMKVQVEGTVRVMHPGSGMGIEFASRTPQDSAAVANFISFLSSNRGTSPELLITPRALSDNHLSAAPDEEIEDPLLDLLRRHESLTQEEFQQELYKQRTPETVTSSS